MENELLDYFLVILLSEVDMILKGLLLLVSICMILFCRSWKLMKELLGTHLGYSTLFTLTNILKNK